MPIDYKPADFNVDFEGIFCGASIDLPPKPPRYCKMCGQRLSILNKNKTCFRHDDIKLRGGKSKSPNGSTPGKCMSTKPCRRCGGFERYLSNRACVFCTQQKARRISSHGSE